MENYIVDIGKRVMQMDWEYIGVIEIIWNMGYGKKENRLYSSIKSKLNQFQIIR